MNFDQWQEHWKRQPAPAAPDGEALAAALKKIRADARTFESALFWRDLTESVVALLGGLFFASIAVSKARAGQPAAVYWIAAALPLLVIVFCQFERIRTRLLRAAPGDSVVAEIDRAIARLRHQDRLLRNVFWWYILPLAASGGLVGFDAVFHLPVSAGGRVLIGAPLLAFNILVGFCVYRLNQRARRARILPALEELVARRRDFSPHAGER